MRESKIVLYTNRDLSELFLALKKIILFPLEYRLVQTPEDAKALRKLTLYIPRLILFNGKKKPIKYTGDLNLPDIQAWLRGVRIVF